MTFYKFNFFFFLKEKSFTSSKDGVVFPSPFLVVFGMNEMERGRQKRFISVDMEWK